MAKKTLKIGTSVTFIKKIRASHIFLYFRDFFYLPSAYISLIIILARIYTYTSIIHNTEMTFLKAILFNFYVKCQAKVVTNIFGFFYDLVFEFAPLFNNIFTKWHLWPKFLFLLFPYSIVFKCLNLQRPFLSSPIECVAFERLELLRTAITVRRFCCPSKLF